jgi:hypothetical protein
MSPSHFDARGDRAFEKEVRAFAGKALEFLINLSETDPIALASGQRRDRPKVLGPHT